MQGAEDAGAAAMEEGDGEPAAGDDPPGDKGAGADAGADAGGADGGAEASAKAAADGGEGAAKEGGSCLLYTSRRG